MRTATSAWPAGSFLCVPLAFYFWNEWGNR